MRNGFSVNIKDRLVRKINKISKETKKDKSYHVNKALENYLAELEDLKTAKKRLEDKKDLVVSLKEMKKFFGL